MRCPRRSEKAFTLVELLIVVAVIAVLIGLLLPAVQKVRETASRTKCQCNMGQLALATIHHEQTFGRFPAGYQTLSSAGNPSGWGWSVSVLPYLEQANLARKIGLDRSILDEANAAYRESRLPHFVCPSDPAPESHEFELPASPINANEPSATRNPVKFASSQYVAVSGTTATDGPDNNGVMFRDSQVTAGEVTDGLSQTLLLGERSSNLGLGIWHGAVPGLQVRQPARRDGMHGEVKQAVFPSSCLVLGTTRGMGALDSDAKPADTFGSFHQSGANMAFTDGHAVFFPGFQSGELLSALATRSGGEASPAP
jgi:prepilin-type N-terminal cleavage/methylation domain-containing protein/prepilin-type processing-associated H-X9-DG protein